MSHEIDYRMAVRGEITFRVSIAEDTDARPEDYDCYTPQDVQGWRDDLWRYVGVIVWVNGLPSAQASVWGVEWSQSADASVGCDWDDLWTDYVPDLIGELKGLVEAERDAITAMIDKWPDGAIPLEWRKHP